MNIKIKKRGQNMNRDVAKRGMIFVSALLAISLTGCNLNPFSVSVKKENKTDTTEVSAVSETEMTTETTEEVTETSAPESLEYSNSDYHYSIELPSGWKKYDNAEQAGYLVMGGNYDFFMNENRDSVMVSKKDGTYDDSVFIQSFSQSVDTVVGSKYTLVSSQECKAGNLAAYQVVTKCNSGNMEGITKVLWAVNDPSDNYVYTVYYYYYDNDEVTEDLTGTLLDSITFGTNSASAAEAPAETTAEATMETFSSSGFYNESNTKRIGNDTVGYIDVPSEFVEFKEIGGLTGVVDGVQYSDPTGIAVFTLSAYKNSDLTAEQAANNAYLNCQAKSGSEVKGAEVEIAGYKAKQVYTYYENEGKFLVIWAFETSDHDDYTHYLSIEFPDNYRNIWELNETFGFNSER